MIKKHLLSFVLCALILSACIPSKDALAPDETTGSAEAQNTSYTVDDVFNFRYDGNLLSFQAVDDGTLQYALASTNGLSAVTVEFTEIVPGSHPVEEAVLSEELYTFYSTEDCSSAEASYCFVLTEGIYGRSFEVTVSPREGFSELDRKTVEGFLFSLSTPGGALVEYGAHLGEDYEIDITVIFENLTYQDVTSELNGLSAGSITLLDEANYYLEFKTAAGAEGMMTVFMNSDDTPLVAVTWEKQFYLLKQAVFYKDVSKVVLPPEVAGKDLSEFSFVLPRYGTDLMVLDARSGAELYVLKWTGERFVFN